MAPDYTDYVAQLRDGLPELAAEFAAWTGIEQVLQWMNRRGLNQVDIDIVGQDEFHYDFLVRFDGRERWLAFGVN